MTLSKDRRDKWSASAVLMIFLKIKFSAEYSPLVTFCYPLEIHLFSKKTEEFPKNIATFTSKLFRRLLFWLAASRNGRDGKSLLQFFDSIDNPTRAKKIPDQLSLAGDFLC